MAEHKSFEIMHPLMTQCCPSRPGSLHTETPEWGSCWTTRQRPGVMPHYSLQFGASPTPQQCGWLATAVHWFFQVNLAVEAKQKTERKKKRINEKCAGPSWTFISLEAGSLSKDGSWSSALGWFSVTLQNRKTSDFYQEKKKGFTKH